MGSPEAPGVEDVLQKHFASVALMACDLASPLTAAVVNVACGEIAD